jgi:hypothetical protein
MKTINNIYIVVAVLSIIVFSSCEKVIDMNIDEQNPKIVLISYLNPDSLIEVSLTKSLHILDYDSVIFIKTAKVKVYENDVLLEELIYNTSDNSFRSNTYKPTVGKRYRIEAAADGYKDVSVEAEIPIPVEIASIDTFQSEVKHTIDPSQQMLRPLNGNFTIKLSFNDPLQDENFYIISVKNTEIYKTDYYINDYYMNFSINSLLIEYSSYSQFLDFRAESNETGFNGGNSEENYIYASQIAFSDKAMNGKQVNFELNIDNSVYADSVHYDIQLTSISKDYYRYLASDVLYRDSDGPFTEKVQIYNNIKNGFGIVLSSSDAVKTITRTKNTVSEPYYEGKISTFKNIKSHQF